jgi:cytochrome c-type biogenesis protein CcmH
MFAIAAMTGWETEDIRVAQIGASFEHGAIRDRASAVCERLRARTTSPPWPRRRARCDGRIAEVLARAAHLSAAGMPTTEAGIDNGFTRDVYLALGDPQEGGGWARAHLDQALRQLALGGTIIMALGGLFSLSDRRYRVAAGAGKTRDRRPKACPRSERLRRLSHRDPALALPTAGGRAARRDPDDRRWERARDISADLRCVVCRNESIDESNAELARDMRLMVRERLVAGDTDEEVVSYWWTATASYVLLRPPMTGVHLILWLAAPVLLMLALGLSGLWPLRRRRRAEEAACPEEEAAPAEILRD